jgi:hypothetical protein
MTIDHSDAPTKQVEWSWWAYPVASWWLPSVLTRPRISQEQVCRTTNQELKNLLTNPGRQLGFQYIQKVTVVDNLHPERR